MPPSLLNLFDISKKSIGPKSPPRLLTLAKNSALCACPIVHFLKILDIEKTYRIEVVVLIKIENFYQKQELQSKETLLY